MKIICESKKEYNDLMKACKYLHDFDMQKSVRKHDIEIDFDTHPLLGLFAHLYLEGHDFPNKHKYVTIRKKKRKSNAKN